jgi:hypothetical protein
MPATVTVQGKNGTYGVGSLVAQNNSFRLQKCWDDSDREMLFQIAVDASHNAALARSSWALKKLKESSDKTEAHYQKKHKGALNYDLGFPELTDSFVFEGQGSRQVNILRFREVLELEKVSPLVKIWKGGLRIDLPTSAWILGKLLKTISFAADNRIQIKDLSGNNVLIHADQHYVIIFDWSDIVIHDSFVPASIIKEEIKQAAKLVIKALGGDLDLARVNDADLPYTKLLQSFATEGMSDLHKAHATFYDVVDSLCKSPDSTWKNGFHEFTTFHV